MDTKFNILVAFDFKPESEAALVYALGVREKLDATVHVLYILEDESPFLRMVITNEQRKLMKRGADEKLKKMIHERTQGNYPGIKTIIKQGKVYQMILETAKEIAVDFIIMGRTDSIDMVKNFLGTNTLHLVRESAIPVITLKKPAKEACCKHFLLPLDLTKQTLKQVSRAINGAKILEASITLVTVLSENLVSLKIKFSTRLREIADIINSFNIKCDYKLIIDTKPVWSKLLNKLAKENNADIVAIMTQQELNFTEYFIGSTAQEIIDNSDLPVLSLTPEKKGPSILPDEMADILINPIQILDY
jgi:nucleotide-binding universal stress UspA family protein